MDVIKSAIGTILGIFVSLFLLFFLFVIFAVIGSMEPQKSVKDNSVLKITLNGGIPFRYVKDPVEDLFSDNKGEKPSVLGLKKVLANAATDDKIKGLWLNLSTVGGAWDNLEMTREAILEFKESGKFVYASTNDIGYTEKAYYLATAADSVFSPIESLFELDGFVIQSTFYTGLLEKVGVDAVITKKGKYKSAVEPYYRTEFSAENEYQLTQMLNNTTDLWATAVSEKTGKSRADIDKILNTAPSLGSHQALEEGFIDAFAYPFEVEAKIKNKIALADKDKLNSIGYSDYFDLAGADVSIKTSDKIAVIYADGQIMPFAANNPLTGSDATITATNIKKTIKKIKKDSRIKAVVVHINSPGGSASTSDLIWAELKELDKDIPVISSMGSVAASGGYYMTMAGRKVVAHPQTITGSIGVFGQLFNAQELLTDKLGIRFDEVKSHDHADWLSLVRPFTKDEQDALQNYVDNTYDTFLTRVSDNRGMSKEEVHERAQGRVWMGADAINEGLVDTLGNLNTALELAAKEAGIEDYYIESFPKEKELAEALFGDAAATAKSWFNFGSSSIQEKGNYILEELKNRQAKSMVLMPQEYSIK